MSLGVVLGLHVFQDAPGRGDVLVAAYRALELAPKVLPDPVSVLHGMVGKYQVANRASVSFLAINEE